MVNQSNIVQTEIILAKQRIEEISAMTMHLAWTKNSKKDEEMGRNETVDSQVVCISSASNTSNMPECHDILALDIFFEKVRSGRKWELKNHHQDPITPCESLIKYQVPRHLIDQTLTQLEEKRNDKTELMEYIKKIQNETRIQLEKLLSAQKDINFDDSIDQNQPINIPDGYKFEGMLLSTKDGTKKWFESNPLLNDK